MSLDNVVRSVAGRLSLREPQAESLRKLAAALEAVPGLRDHRARSPDELAAMIEALKAMSRSCRTSSATSRPCASRWLPGWARHG